MTGENLTRDICHSIDCYLKGNKRRSLSSIAKRSGIAYSTVRRIYRQETQASSQTTLAIIDVTLSLDEKISFLKTHFPQIGELMAECYHQSVEKPQSQEVLREFLRQEPHNRIFNMAATKKGITRNYVKDLAGQLGLDALEEMLDAEILMMDGEIVKYHQQNWALGNVEDALHQVRQSTRYFQKDLVGTEGANLMHATGAIRKECVPEFKKLMIKFIQDVQQLKNAPENEGGLHFFCDLMYSLYDSKELLKNTT